jgi:molybdenum cofactor synthesis domain-containing protein
MKLIKTEEAVGQVLCHDITQIIVGVTKDARFRKGHIVTEDDIPVLLSLGKEQLYIWENNEAMLHENDAAQILRELCQGEYMSATEPKEGKIELIADTDGLLTVDVGRLRMVNSLGEMMIATRTAGPVKKGDKLCGTRIVPLIIEKEKMEEARRAAGIDSKAGPLLKLLPIKAKKYGIVSTGNEVFHGRIQDSFTPVILRKMGEYGCEMLEHRTLPDDHEKITAAITEMLDKGVQMVLCTGGMSVDPDDQTPLAIRNAAGTPRRANDSERRFPSGTVVSYGAPVMPGAMFMLAYTEDGRPVCGLPGCVMYGKRSVFDLVLPYLLADVPVTAEWLAGLGYGGLCLNCVECRFPNCSFGKGAE